MLPVRAWLPVVVVSSVAPLFAIACFGKLAPIASGAPMAPDATAPLACPALFAADAAEPPYFYSDASPFAYVNYVAWGDSITAGSNLTTSGSPQPALAYPHFAAQRMGSNVHESNIGKPGWTSGQILDAAVGDGGEFATWRRPGTLWVASMMAGENDFHWDAGADAIEANLRSWVEEARAAGWLTVVCTIPPPNYQPAWEPWQREVVNAWLRGGGSGADAVCDFDDERMRVLEEWGGVHPNVNGQSWMADRLVRAMAPVLMEAGAR